MLHYRINPSLLMLGLNQTILYRVVHLVGVACSVDFDVGD